MKSSIYKLIHFSVLFCVFFLSVSCNSCQTQKSTLSKESVTYTQQSPDFNSDSAYAFVKKQVDFGPRVPNTHTHQQCGDYLVIQLKGFGATVIEQKTVLPTYDGTKLHARNIIGMFQPEKKDRILLFAHWDTRPFADHDSDPEKAHQPILGANDGASGVGVLLEIARQLQQHPTEVGIDMIFFDAEDWGEPTFAKDVPQGDWWCLGSQYWAKNPHQANYKARFGILLDMVGAPNATFYKEGYSLKYAVNVTDKVWLTAAKLGYANHFINKAGGYITDDHVPVNEHHRAPSIDIIHTSLDSPHGFAPFWHTHKDDMSNIDRNTLKAVGQTVMEVIYTEKK